MQRAAIDGCHWAHQTPRLWPYSQFNQRMGLVARNGAENCPEHAQLCTRCIQFEVRLQKPSLEPILCTEPMDLVHIDYIKMEVTVGLKEKPEVKDVLVVEDHFTHYLQAYITKNHTARTTARVLYNEYFLVFGFSRRLMLDQAREFSGKVIAALCDLLGVAKIHTSPYHPQSNGAVERAHQTLWQMIGKLDPEKWRKWKLHLGSVLIAYNATRSLVMGYSPYFLMFGRRPHLPINLLFPTAMWQGSTRTIDNYVLCLYEKLKEALPIARDSTIMEAQWQKRYYDRRAGAVELQPGDKVLVKLDTFHSQRQKLKNRWSGDLHTVVKCMADGIPTYVVKNDETGKTQVLHCAWLLLWLAEYDGKPIQVNRIMISASLPGMSLETQLHGSDMPWMPSTWCSCSPD